MAYYPYARYPYYQQEHQYPSSFQNLPPRLPPASDRPQLPPPFQPQLYNQTHYRSQPIDPEAIQAIYEAYVYQLQRDREEQDYDYYHKEHQRRKSKLYTSRSGESLNSSYSNGEPLYSTYPEEVHYQNRPAHNSQSSQYAGDDSWRMEVDGEPMNELERLAAENAIINVQRSKYVDLEEEDIKADSKSPSTDLPNLISSLALDDNPPCTTDDQVTSKENNVAVVQHSKKKKSWLFKFFSKKNTPDYFLTTSQPNNSSVPPTPALTPDNSSTSSGPTLHLIDPTLLEKGVWAFQLPASADDSQEWCAFQQTNQKIIMKYIQQFNHPRGIGCNFQLFDKRIAGGIIPVLVAPFYMKCYYATELNPKKIVTMEIRLFQNV
ncbi:hypothetical protein EDC96DRAFT_520173 [Choanephora cucurbitarum]|nr:hypothetical protein EDC96DRAFT_520173 [Choanephora cucurbitarum]